MKLRRISPRLWTKESGSASAIAAACSRIARETPMPRSALIASPCRNGFAPVRATSSSTGGAFSLRYCLTALGLSLSDAPRSATAPTSSRFSSTERERLIASSSGARSRAGSTRCAAIALSARTIAGCSAAAAVAPASASRRSGVASPTMRLGACSPPVGTRPVRAARSNRRCRPPCPPRGAPGCRRSPGRGRRCAAGRRYRAPAGAAVGAAEDAVEGARIDRAARRVDRQRLEVVPFRPLSAPTRAQLAPASVLR